MRVPHFAALIGILGLLVLAIGWREARADPAVRRAAIALPGWPKAAPSLSVALIGDMHIGSSTMDADRLARIVDRVNALRPDLVLIAGDFIAGHRAGTAARLGVSLTAPLRRLRAPMGTIAVLGNHDHWTGAEDTARAVRSAGVTLLRNQAVRRGPLAIGGVDDVMTRHADWPATRRALRDVGGVPLVLSHSPDIAARLEPGDPRLVLAGHTHCGQIVLPLIGAITTASDFGDRYRCGLIQEGDRRTLVTAGLGTSVLPLRYGAAPDLWLIRLGPTAITPAAGRTPPTTGR